MQTVISPTNLESFSKLPSVILFLEDEVLSAAAADEPLVL